jgi:hypothetical protein
MKTRKSEGTLKKHLSTKKCVKAWFKNENGNFLLQCHAAVANTLVASKKPEDIDLRVH